MPWQCVKEYDPFLENNCYIQTELLKDLSLKAQTILPRSFRKWSTQSREAAPWYQHEEIGYNYRMSNIIAGVIRGQIPYLNEHVSQKTAIYERYKKCKDPSLRLFLHFFYYHDWYRCQKQRQQALNAFRNRSTITRHTKKADADHG